MITYDSKIINEFAVRLYDKASAVVRNYTILGMLIGCAAGFAAAKGIGAVIGIFIGAAVGYMIGKDKAFIYKLQAQTALCQAQIEANTKN